MMTLEEKRAKNREYKKIHNERKRNLSIKGTLHKFRDEIFDILRDKSTSSENKLNEIYKSLSKIE